MAGESVTTKVDRSKTFGPQGLLIEKHIRPEWLMDEVWQAFNPLETAIRLIADRHFEGNQESADEITLLETLLKGARDRLQAFDDAVAQHFGDVGIYRANYDHPGVAKDTIVGVRFIPKKEDAQATGGEVDHE